MYGKMLVLDMHNCNKKTMTKGGVDAFLGELCKLIGMEPVQKHHWVGKGISKEEWRNNPHLQGVSTCQFIKTSSIVVHCIKGLGNVYVDIFSCRDFDVRLAEGYCIAYWEGEKKNCVVLDRV